MLAAGATTVRFDRHAPETGPFPADSFTVEDSSRTTGLRVDLPLDSCASQPMACRDLRLLNELDGFNPNSRLRVSFSGPVNPDTLKDGLRLVAGETVIGVNQVVWDPATNTAYARPDRVLESGRRYTLAVTGAIRDTEDKPVEADPAFSACLGEASGYCAALALGVGEASAALAPARIVGASVFTTLASTAWLEQARADLDSLPPRAERSSTGVVAFSELSTVTLHEHVGVNPDRFEDFSLPFSMLTGVRGIAFGSYRSPNYLDERQVVTAAPPAENRIYFHVLVPSKDKPASGYPVVITGHGFTDNRFAGPSALSLGFAGQGMAIIAINAVGHGYGPKTTLVARGKAGNINELEAPGRAVDLNGDGTYDDQEGCLVLTPEAPIGLRDCLRQTVVDLMQLVRAVRAGIDLDGDGTPDLDPDRIYYAGISLGAIYGTMLNAIEPDIRAAVLNVGGGSVIDIVRLGKSYHSYAAALLGQLGMLNRDGDFDEAWPLRDQPVRVVNDAKSLQIQELFDHIEWLTASGDPLFFASRLKKPVLWLIAKGDQSVPNPANSALIRAAGMRESTWLYRHDLARKAVPSLSENPHAFMADLFSLPSLAIALAAQQQAAGFLSTGTISNPNGLLRFLFGKDIFEVPDVLPEELNY